MLITFLTFIVRDFFSICDHVYCELNMYAFSTKVGWAFYGPVMRCVEGYEKQRRCMVME